MEKEARPSKSNNIETAEGYQTSDDLAEQSYTDIINLTGDICETPIVLFSLFDNDRHWLKSNVELESRQISHLKIFCKQIFHHSKEFFLAEDLSIHPQFADHFPVIEKPPIRFCASAPLIADQSEFIGTLSVLDYKPRDLSDKQKFLLQVLARQIVGQIETQQLVQKMKAVERRQREVLSDLRESKARFEEFMKNSPMVAYMKDEDGKFVYVNQPLEKYFDVEEGELIGKDDLHIMPDNLAQKVREHDELVLSKMEPMELLEETESQEGHKNHWLSVKFPFTDVKGKKFIGGISLDVTERKLAEEKLNESEERYRNLFELSPGYISVHDAKGVIVSVNAAAANALKYETDEIIGKNLADFMTPDSRANFQEHIKHINEHPHDDGIMNVLTKSGEQRTWQYRNRVHHEKDGKDYLIGYAQDITELKQIEQKLHDLTLRDELTGLYNRRGFSALAKQAWRYARRNRKSFLIIYADLDNLKSVNDNFGHAAGSQMITDTANIFKRLFRDSDIVARFGGDEFVILVQDCSEKDIEAIRRRLQNQIEEFNNAASESFSMSISFGFAAFDSKSDTNVEDLISKADDLMYSHKRQKKLRS